MDAKTARETVMRPQLLEVFGTGGTNLLITKATSAGISGNGEAEKLMLMVDSICSDSKVIKMWGNAETVKKKNEWLRLLN